LRWRLVAVSTRVIYGGGSRDVTGIERHGNTTRESI
jgi:hypothetical protein